MNLPVLWLAEDPTGWGSVSRLVEEHKWLWVLFRNWSRTQLVARSISRLQMNASSHLHACTMAKRLNEITMAKREASLIFYTGEAQKQTCGNESVPSILAIRNQPCTLWQQGCYNFQKEETVTVQEQWFERFSWLATKTDIIISTVYNILPGDNFFFSLFLPFLFYHSEMHFLLLLSEHATAKSTVTPTSQYCNHLLGFPMI